VTPEACEEIVRELFRSRDPSAPPRVGVEAEFLCMRADRREPVPARRDGDSGSASVPVVAALAARRGWRREEAPGLPLFRLPDGTTIGWEPGGQIEVATPPLTDLGVVDARLRHVVGDLADALRGEGIALLARGLDPWTEVLVPRLQLDHPRYRRMAAHYDAAGHDGRRMMRQTAGVHVNLDLGPEPFERWRRANACIPALIAIFANSRRVEGRRGWRSERSRAWRRLDPSRTGAFRPTSDPPSDYLAFARAADAFLVGPEGAPVDAWQVGERERSGPEWRTHLSTLFPEVRPRGYLEIRAVDALAPDALVVAAGFLAGIVYGTASTPEVPPPTRKRLERAGERGLADTALWREALAWWSCARAGLEELGPAFAPDVVTSRVDAWVERFTGARRDPGDLREEWVETPPGAVRAG